MIMNLFNNIKHENNKTIIIDLITNQLNTKLLIYHSQMLVDH